MYLKITIEAFRMLCPLMIISNMLFAWKYYQEENTIASNSTVLWAIIWLLTWLILLTVF